MKTPDILRELKAGRPFSTSSRTNEHQRIGECRCCDDTQKYFTKRYRRIAI